MFSTIRSRLWRYRTRLLVRSALNGGILYRLLRRWTGNSFNDRAASWDQMVADHAGKWFAPLDEALDRLPAEWTPERVLDIGGGTGRAAYYLAKRYPEAEITVLDLAQGMLSYGKDRQQSEVLAPVAFVAGESTEIPMRSGSFDLVFVLNAPPNTLEMARVLAPGGAAVLAFTYGPHTPMYLDEQASFAALQRSGFEKVSSGTGGEGTWVSGVRKMDSPS